MLQHTKQLIKYEGISKPFEGEWITDGMVRSSIEGMGRIQGERYPVKDIIKFKVVPKIKHYEVVNTPIGQSVEGQKLTGKGMLIVGEWNFRIQYLNDHSESQIHTTRLKETFAEYIVLPQQSKVLPYISPDICILDLYIRLLEDNIFFYSIIFVLSAHVN